MGTDKNRNYKGGQIHLTEEAARVFRRWRETKRKNTGIHYISECFIEILERDITETEVKKGYAVAVHPALHGEITIKQAECIEIIKRQYKINEMSEEQFDKLLIPYGVFVSIVGNIMKLKNERTINREKRTILIALNMKQLRIGNSHFIVSKYYETHEGIEQQPKKRLSLSPWG